jgi:hypothetical protein
MALAALSRKNALMVEPIRRTWRKSASYSSGRSLTVIRTVRPTSSSASVIQNLAHIDSGWRSNIAIGRIKLIKASGLSDTGRPVTRTILVRTPAASRPDREDIGTFHKTYRTALIHFVGQPDQPAVSAFPTESAIAARSELAWFRGQALGSKPAGRDSECEIRQSGSRRSALKAIRPPSRVSIAAWIMTSLPRLALHLARSPEFHSSTR